MAFRRRFLLTFLIVAACGSAVIAALASSASRDVVFSPIVAEPSGWPTLTVALEETTANPGRYTYVLYLTAADPKDFVTHDEVRIRLATYRAEPVRARLFVVGTRCLYESPDTVLPINGELSFVRGRSCIPQESVATGELELTLELPVRYPVALWTVVAPTELQQVGFVFVSRPSSIHPHSRPIVRGTYVDYGPTTSFRRIDLLNYVWGLTTRPWWIWSVLGVAATLLVAGGLLFPLRHVSGYALTTVAAMFCLAAGLGLAYAVIVPPLQAPDEPDHLLSFAALTGRPDLARQAADLAKRGHLERIKFSPNRFRPADVDRPFPTPWGEHVETEDVRQRSSTTKAIWSAVAPWLRNTSAAGTLLVVRSINVLIFAICVALGTALLITLSPGIPYPQLGMFLFLFVPALPFFALHMSEYAFLASAYVLLSCCLLVLFLDGPRSHVIGLPLGLSAAITMATSRSALPLVPLLACVAIARATMGSSGSAAAGWRERLTQAAIFWGGLVVGAGTFHLLAAADYTTAQWELASRMLPATVRQPVAYLTDHEWTLVLAGVAACGIEAAVGEVRRRGASRFGPTVARIVAWAWAAALAGVLIVSVFQSFPLLPALVYPSFPAPRLYVTSVITAMLTTLRFGTPDVLLVSSFWTGFGWIDTIPSARFVSGLAVATGLSWMVLLTRLGRRKESRRVAWLVWMGIGLGMSLALYAVAAVSTARDVHGRYLIGFYLSLLSIAWITPALLGRPAPAQSPGDRPHGVTRVPLFLVICGAIHAYSLFFIVNRYF